MAGRFDTPFRNKYPVSQLARTGNLSKNNFSNVIGGWQYSGDFFEVFLVAYGTVGAGEFRWQISERCAGREALKPVADLFVVNVATFGAAILAHAAPSVELFCPTTGCS